MKALKRLFFLLSSFHSFVLMFSCTVFLLFPYKSGAQSQEYLINNITVDDGLPQSSVSDIIQDKDGYIWLATEDGLVRYDGYEFKSYQHQSGDSTSIRTSFVNYIAEDKEGYIWVSLVIDLIDKFDKQTEKISR